MPSAASRRIVRLVLASLLVLVVLVLPACVVPLDLIPPDADISKEEAVLVRFGVGVAIQQVDGRGVRTKTRALVTPGPHRYVVHVRRSYRKVTDELAGVFAVGVCEVVLDGAPGDDFEIRTYLETEVDRTGYRRSDPLGSTYTTFQIGLFTEDHQRGEVRAERCPLRMDCRALDTRRMAPSGQCTYEPFPPE